MHECPLVSDHDSSSKNKEQLLVLFLVIFLVILMVSHGKSTSKTKRGIPDSTTGGGVRYDLQVGLVKDMFGWN